MRVGAAAAAAGDAGMPVCETARLAIRRFTLADAAFLLEQVNQPGWLRNIGDRGVRTLEDARGYIQSRILDPYRVHGFGMYLLLRKTDGLPVGMCGLVRRDTLPAPDIGFALLQDAWGQGYALEAAAAVMRHAVELGIPRVLAIVTPGNAPSCRLLEKLGFRRTGTVEQAGETLLRYEAVPGERPDAALDIRIDDVRGAQIIALLEEHRRSMFLHSPPESVHALDLDGLRRSDVTVWTAWRGDALLGCGALKQLDARHGEIKSMRTAATHLRQGVATRLLEHIVGEARQRGYRRLSLETGSMEAFAPARSLYRRYGFVDCGPFGDYAEDPYSAFMTREL